MTDDTTPEMYTAYAFYLEQRREERRRRRQEFDERKREYDLRKGPIMNDVFGPILGEYMKEQISGKKLAVKETLAADRRVPAVGWSMMKGDDE